jgi:hypothetical protein
MTLHASMQAGKCYGTAIMVGIVLGPAFAAQHESTGIGQAQQWQYVYSE